LDEERDQDEVMEAEGFSFMMDKELYDQAKPLTLDFNQMGFDVKSRLELPDASGGCSSCGSWGWGLPPGGGRPRPTRGSPLPANRLNTQKQSGPGPRRDDSRGPTRPNRRHPVLFNPVAAFHNRHRTLAPRNHFASPPSQSWGNFCLCRNAPQEVIRCFTPIRPFAKAFPGWPLS
jgi:hypothetical protein